MDGQDKSAAARLFFHITRLFLLAARAEPVPAPAPLSFEIVLAQFIGAALALARENPHFRSE